MDRTKSELEKLDSMPGDEDVVSFLRRNPDFLARRPELAQSLEMPVPDRGKDVVDFQHYMMQRLRDTNAGLKEQHRELVATARANMNIQARVHSAVLFLLDARNFEQFIHTITSDLAVLLDVDSSNLVMEWAGELLPEERRAGIRMVQPGTVDEVMGQSDILLVDNTLGDERLFGEAAGLIASEVLIRLEISASTPPAMLALGSRNPDMFHEGQATELISFLARVIERLVRAWLDLPEN